MPALPKPGVLVWLGAMLLLSPGCSQYRAPAIRIVDAAITERTDEATRVEVTVDLENRNDEPMELRRFTYRFRAGRAAAYQGLRAGEATVRAHGTKRVVLPAIVTGPIDGPITWTLRGEVIYTTPGELAEILLDTGIRKPVESFSGSGALGDGS